mgnify:CR=1 FL=1
MEVYMFFSDCYIVSRHFSDVQPVLTVSYGPVAGVLLLSL